MWLRSAGRLVFLTATTPVDAQHCELKPLFLAREEPGARELSPESRALIQLIADTTARDVPIWEHKVYRARPALVPGDGPIGRLRRWAGQSHEAPTPECD